MKIPEYSSYIELNKNALKKNYGIVREMIGKKSELISVVKGNAYGHGIKEFLSMAEEAGMDYFATYDDHEAYEVLKSLTDKKKKILIMGKIGDDAISWAIENGVEFYIFNKSRLKKTVEASVKIGKKAKIHIEVETGLNRTGFNREEFKDLFGILKRNKNNLNITGICTHYAGAENISNSKRINDQIREFDSICKIFSRNNIGYKKRHTACSAAVLNYPETTMDMVRIGILLYGFWPSKETEVSNYISKKKKAGFKRIISWKSRVMAVKKVKAGDYVGYGTSYLPEKNTRTAVIPVGYAHGFNRSFSNFGRVLIRGKRLSVIGIVNMNCIIADITNYPEIDEGDEVVLIGKQGNREITVSSFSEMSKQMNYELLVRLPKDIPRKIIK